jgi:hypothetical protein
MAKRSILRVDGPCEGRGRAHRQISSREGQRPVRALWCWRGERKCTYVHYVTHFMSLLWIRTRTPRGAEGTRDRLRASGWSVLRREGQ